MSRLQIAAVDDDAQWDAGVDASPQGTVFCRSSHLRALGQPFRRLAVKSGGKTVALLPLVENDAGDAVVQPAYTPYQGILLLPDDAAPRRQQVLDAFRIGEFAVAELTGRYRAVAMPLSWTFDDLRPFLWHRYHDADAPRFAVTPRYTALLDLRGAIGDPAATASADHAADRKGEGIADRIAAEARACRRQELRKAANCTVSESPDVDRFIALYAETFARQDIALPGESLALVRRITEAALAGGYGRLSACSTPQGVASVNLFVYDRRRAYYLFAANDPALRNSGAATRLMFDNLAEAGRRGLREVDFVGVNSPNRGDFKLSFNPALQLYFEVALAAA